MLIESSGECEHGKYPALTVLENGNYKEAEERNIKTLADKHNCPEFIKSIVHRKAINRDYTYFKHLEEQENA